MHDETTPATGRTSWKEHTVLDVHLWDDGATFIEAQRPRPDQTILCITNDVQQWEVNLRCHDPRILNLLRQALILLDAQPTPPQNEQPAPEKAPLDPKRPIGLGRPRKQERHTA
jgi:hypothetical protein